MPEKTQLSRATVDAMGYKIQKARFDKAAKSPPRANIHTSTPDTAPEDAHSTPASRDAKGYIEQELRKTMAKEHGPRAVVSTREAGNKITRTIDTLSQQLHDKSLRDFQKAQEAQEEFKKKEIAAKTQHQADIAKLEEMNQYDTLLEKQKTLSLKEFNKRAGRALQTTQRAGGEFQYLIIDADKFKIVNDTYGHPVGDTQLKILAFVLAEIFHREDDAIGRIGGEELAVALPNTTAQQAVMLLLRVQRRYREVQKIMRSPNRPTDFPEGPYPDKIPDQTFSTGLASRSENDPDTGKPVDTIDSLKEKADIGLYRAKQTRNTIAVNVGGEKQFQVFDNNPKS